MVSRTILADTGGFTPVIDDLVTEFDFMTALVFGKVWRYCQMEHGCCHAAIGTMADQLGIARMTLITRLDKLVENGYLEKRDGKPGEPKIYIDTGKAGIRIGLTAGIGGGYLTVRQGVSNCYTGGVQQLDIKRVDNKEVKIEKDISAEKSQPKHTSNLPQSEPRSKHPAIIAYREIVKRYPKTDLFDIVIDALGNSPNTPKAKACWVEWMARGYNTNSVKWLEWYRNGIPPKNGKAPIREPERIEEWDGRHE